MMQALQSKCNLLGFEVPVKPDRTGPDLGGKLKPLIFKKRLKEHFS